MEIETLLEITEDMSQNISHKIREVLLQEISQTIEKHFRHAPPAPLMASILGATCFSLMEIIISQSVNIYVMTGDTSIKDELIRAFEEEFTNTVKDPEQVKAIREKIQVRTIN